jgi:hypothetical protein
MQTTSKRKSAVPSNNQNLAATPTPRIWADKAPYIVTLIAAAVAWTLTHIVDRLLATPLVTYRQEVVENQGKKSLYLTLKNITDRTGEVPQPPRDCGKMRMLHARPFDSGSYFNSDPEPCAQKIILRVLSRQTPKGAAINYQIVPFTLPDGSPGVMTVKAALESKTSETSSEGRQRQCQITLNAIADQHAFKIQGDTWVALKHATT